MTHRYGGFTAVDDLTLQVAVGETLGLLGANGAGKTAVVKLLPTLARSRAVRWRIFGLDAGRDPHPGSTSPCWWLPQRPASGPPSALRRLVA